MKKLFCLMMIIGAFTFYGCDVQVDEEELAVIEESATSLKGLLNKDECTAAEKVSCANDLVYSGCNFTSGSGSYLWQIAAPFQAMLNGPNNCRIEALPAGCSWSNQYQTRYFFVELNGCCYNWGAMNFRMNNIFDTAKNNRPTNRYLVSNYAIQYQSNGGAPRLLVDVTYRRRIGICSIGSDDNDDKEG